MIGSGRCHGPHCTQDARDGFFCSEEHQTAWHRQFCNKVTPPSEEAVRCIMDAAPTLPEGLADLMTVDPDPHPQPGELWRVGQREAVLVWVRKILPDGVADVIAVTMEVEMAELTSLLVSATSTPFQTPLAVLTMVRTHLPWSVFLSRICALDIARDVEEVIRADRAGRLPTGCWVGPPITSDDDERIAFRQQLMALLASWAPSQIEDAPLIPEEQWAAAIAAVQPEIAERFAATIRVDSPAAVLAAVEPPADAPTLEDVVQAIGTLPQFEPPEPVKLTPEQFSSIRRATTDPSRQLYGDALGSPLFGVPVELVEREQDSTPYLEQRRRLARALRAASCRQLTANGDATFPQVAPGELLDVNPQVADNSRRSEPGEPGWLGRAFHWLFGRTP